MRDTVLPSVCVIVSHLNSKRTIGKCLANLLQQDYPSDRFQILVVDGGSTDGSIDIVERLKKPNLSQIVASGCREAEGQNIGIQSSQSDVIMFTNSDIYVPHDWMRKHVEWLIKGYDLVGGRVFWGGDKYALTWNMPKPKEPQFSQQKGMSLGFSNCSFSRRLFKRVGVLVNLSSMQDAEFGFRAMRAGAKIVLDPTIEVYHDHPFCSRWGSFSRAFKYIRNSAIIMKSAFGRIVLGSGGPVMVSLGYLFREWTCYNGVKTYTEIRLKAYQRSIMPSLPEFLITRLFATKLGQFLGAFMGAIQPKPTFSRVADLHGQPTTKQ